MPVPPNVVGPLVQAGAQLAGVGLNAGAQGATNRKARKFQEQMYERQRKDSLADWNMMNEYNDPRQQMARLKAAGLNPNLVYGKGADNTAPAVRASTPGAWNPKAPDLNIGPAFASFYDTQFKQAQTNNLKQQNAVLTQEAALKAAQTANLATQTARGQFDLDLAGELRKTSLDTARAQLDKINNETAVLLRRDEREAIAQSSSLKEAAERITSLQLKNANNALERAQIRANINSTEVQTAIKQKELELRNMGLNPNDPTWMKVVMEALVNMGVIDKIQKGSKFLGDLMK